MERISTEPLRKKTKIPMGAKILEKNRSTYVEEIENGFLIRTNWDIKYSLDDEEGYCYPSKTVFSKINPVKLDKTYLADKF
jgi:hypothetical protein